MFEFGTRETSWPIMFAMYVPLCLRLTAAHTNLYLGLLIAFIIATRR